MEKAHKVLIRRCEAYDPDRIAGIVKEGMQDLGVTPSGNILLKPNVVLAHPEFFPHAFTRKEFLDGVIAATKEMFEATGAKREDTEEFINLPRALRSVKVAVFFKEMPEGLVKASLRAKGGCDVSQVAMNYGGGGHRNAAGYWVKDKTLDEARDELLHELKRSLKSRWPAD